MSSESNSQNFWSMCMCIDAFNSVVNFVKKLLGLQSDNDLADIAHPSDAKNNDVVSKTSETSSNSSSFVTAPCESIDISYDDSSFVTAPEESIDMVSIKIEKLSLSKKDRRKTLDLSY